MPENLVMPRIIFSVDLVENQSVIDDKRSKALLSLTVIESSPVFSDLIEESLPAVDIITQPLINFLGINHPQCLIVEPNLQVVFSVLENVEDLTVSAFKHLGSHFEQHILIILFSFIFLHE